MVPKRARRLADCAHPVVQQPYPHAVARFRGQRVGKQPARLIFMNDVALEMNVTLGSFDRLEPRGIILSRILQQPDAIAADERRSRRTRESLVRQVTYRQQSVSFMPVATLCDLSLGRHARIVLLIFSVGDWLCQSTRFFPRFEVVEF